MRTLALLTTVAVVAAVATAAATTAAADGKTHQGHSESFHEELVLRPLPDARLLAHFAFTTRTDAGHPHAFAHFDLFPKTLGQILDEYGVIELSLTFTRGRWHYDQWGYAPKGAPVGAEMWAWFDPETVTDVDGAWKGLTNSLSGMFSSSLGFLDETLTTSPTSNFKPAGAHNKFAGEDLPSSHLRYGALPREPVCTENLTPWVKLLPCSSKVGIASLLNALTLYKGQYHSMAVHVRHVCTDAADTSCTTLELSQTITGVLTTTSRDWSVTELFDRAASDTTGGGKKSGSKTTTTTSSSSSKAGKGKGESGSGLSGAAGLVACSLATESRVYVQLAAGSDDLFVGDGSVTLSPSGSESWVSGDGSVVTHSYTLSATEPVDVRVAFGQPNIPPFARFAQPPLDAHRYFTGYGMETGGTVTEITNSGTASVNVTYLSIVPWYMETYLHTLAVVAEPLGSESSDSERVGLEPLDQRLSPAKDRGAPGVVEMKLSVPPSTRAIVSSSYDKSFLRYAEHPPDPNRGFDIPCVLVAAEPSQSSGHGWLGGYITGLEWSPAVYGKERSDGGGDTSPYALYTESLLMPMPTPDFSMPYNVITFTCTIFALAVGSTLNGLIKDFGATEVKKDNAIKRLLKRCCNRGAATEAS